MVGGFIFAMARLAVIGPHCSMVENRLPPGVRVMAQRTLSAEVVSRFVLAVATLAVNSSARLVIKTGWQPGAHLVAGGALPAEMVGRFIRTVATLAVCRARQAVIEVDISPIVCGMACRTFAVEMGDWLYIGMTGCALWVGA